VGEGEVRWERAECTQSKELWAVEGTLWTAERVNRGVGGMAKLGGRAEQSSNQPDAPERGQVASDVRDYAELK
jgi:hypothetical protein